MITRFKAAIHQKRIQYLLNPAPVRKKCLLAFFYLFTLAVLIFTFQKMIEDSRANARTSLYPLSDASDASAAAKNVLRFHVIASSDSEKDQQIKRKVRDEILSYLRQDLKNAESRGKAEEIVQAKIPLLTQLANRTLAKFGSGETARLSLAYRLFPQKTYGEFTFPQGTYRALCVEIGKAQGKNWWCVLFPSLCFVNETTAAVPEASKKKLKASLTEEQYASLQAANRLETPSSSPEDTTVEIRSGFFDWLQSLKQ